jgi:hypothetical protein
MDKEVLIPGSALQSLNNYRAMFEALAAEEPHS